MDFFFFRNTEKGYLRFGRNRESFLDNVVCDVKVLDEVGHRKVERYQTKRTGRRML